MAVQRESAEGRALRSAEKQTCHDVLVVGGGPAGLATAIELARHGFDVVVAEAHAGPTERYGETLAPETLSRLDRLGLAQAFLAAGHVRCPGTVVRWGRDRPGCNDFLLHPLGPAWHLDRARFEAALGARAQDCGARLLASTRFVAAERATDRWSARLRGPTGMRTVTVRWLVDSSGPAAALSRRLGARRTVVDRVVALVRIDDLVAGTLGAQTFVESTPDGWWYVARLPGERVVTVFVTDPAMARVLTADHWDGWRRALAGTQLFAERLAGLALKARPDTARYRVRSIRVSRLQPVAGAGWLAVGDAAAELDPIAGRGMHDALGDAREAARAVIAGHPWSVSYEARIHSRFHDHLIERAALYGLEQRWPAARFWQDRPGVA
jgi:flavin-dependent dehydrogenase